MVHPAWGSGLMMGGTQGTPMGPAGGGKCLRERGVLKNAQVKMLESKGPLGHTSPGRRLVKSAQGPGGPASVPQFLETPGSRPLLHQIRLLSSREHWQRHGLLSAWN